MVSIARTYGKKTNQQYSTYQEMNYALKRNPFLIKMPWNVIWEEPAAEMALEGLQGALEPPWRRLPRLELALLLGRPDEDRHDLLARVHGRGRGQADCAAEREAGQAVRRKGAAGAAAAASYSWTLELSRRSSRRR